MDVLHEEITLYSEYRIVKRGPRVDMEVRGAVFAVYHPQHLLSGYSWDALTAAAALSPYKQVRRILMLGVAAGTALRQMRHLWPRRNRWGGYRCPAGESSRTFHGTERGRGVFGLSRC